MLPYRGSCVILKGKEAPVNYSTKFLQYLVPGG
jgi:hypothetical protein